MAAIIVCAAVFVAFFTVTVFALLDEIGYFNRNDG